MKSTVESLVLLAAVLAVTAAMPGPARAGGKVTIPFDAANFPASPNIDNPFWPLVPGTTLTYVAGSGEECEVNTVAVLHPDAQAPSPEFLPPFNPKTIATSTGPLNVITVYDVGWATDCDSILDSPDFEDLEENPFQQKILGGRRQVDGKFRELLIVVGFVPSGRQTKRAGDIRDDVIDRLPGKNRLIANQ